MFRYRLHTLLIVLAIGPPMLAAIWFVWSSWDNNYEIDVAPNAIEIDLSR